MRPFLPFATLLGAVFLLGCQGLTAPEAQPIVLMEVAAPVAIRASGIIVSINRPETHGVIARTDDGSNTLYQFNIPSTRRGKGIIVVGKVASFTIDPGKSRFVILGDCLDLTFPPCPGL